MNDAQVDELLSELKATRESFDKAISTIKWNKINTIIQYCLIVVVIVLGGLFINYYFDQRKQDCVRSNEFRSAVGSSLDTHAANIGVSLGIVADADPDLVRDFLEIYKQQEPPPILEPREC